MLSPRVCKPQTLLYNAEQLLKVLVPVGISPVVYVNLLSSAHISVSTTAWQKAYPKLESLDQVHFLCTLLAPVLTPSSHEPYLVACTGQKCKDPAQIPSCWPSGSIALLSLRPHVPQAAPSQGWSTVKVQIQVHFYYTQDSSDR